MAKIQSPSGETEFFQITDIEKAFEKELKTGEKIAIAPGVREASFLREAPVRAEYTEAFQEFKDRILNPYTPPTQPAFRYFCTQVVRPLTLFIDEAFTNTVAYSSMPELTFVTTLDTSQGFFSVPQCNATFPSLFTGTEWEWSLGPLPFSSTTNRSKGSQFQIDVPNYYTLSAYAQIDPVIPNSGEIDFYGITITPGLGGGVGYATGAFVCTNLPAGYYKIFELTADLFVPAYTATPYPYGLTNCSYTLLNYTFTNLYP